MGSSNSKVNVESCYENIPKVLNLYKSVVSEVKNAVQEILVAKRLEEIADQINNISHTFQKKEKEALETIINIHIRAKNAIRCADDVVRNIKRVGSDLLRIMNGDEERSKERLKLIISVYRKESQDLLEKIKEVTEMLLNVTNEVYRVNSAVNALKTFIEREEYKLDLQKSVDCAKSRGNCYSGAAEATIGAGIACAFIPVVGWIAGIVLTTGAAAVTFGTATGILEGVTVKQVKEQYQNGLKTLDGLKNNFEHMGKKTKEIIKKVDVKIKQLKDIEDLLKTSSSSARNALEEEDKYFQEFYDNLKEDLEKLQQVCEEYQKL